METCLATENGALTPNDSVRNSEVLCTPLAVFAHHAKVWGHVIVTVMLALFPQHVLAHRSAARLVTR